MLPKIDMIKTGANITALRKRNKLTVRDIQNAMGFNTPQAIFKWQRGDTLPSVDNLLILSDMFNVTINDILIVEK